MKEDIRYNGEFNFIHPQTGLKVDFWIKRYPFENLKKAIVKKLIDRK